MENKDVLLRILNNVMLNTTELINQILNYDTEVTDKDITNAEQAKKLLTDLDILEEVPF